jgi:hypothetical protein
VETVAPLLRGVDPAPRKWRKATSIKSKAKAYPAPALRVFSIFARHAEFWAAFCHRYPALQEDISPLLAGFLV